MTATQSQSVARGQQLGVFLCHSSRDKKRVRDLYERLKSEGFAPWLDECDLLPGQEWKEEIAAALRRCDAVVVCLSKNSITREGFIQKEIKIVLDIAEEKPEGTIFVIPVRLDEVVVPQSLRKWQWADLFDESGYKKIMLALNKQGAERGIEGIAPCNLGGSITTEPRVKMVIKLDCTLEEFKLVSDAVQELFRKVSNDATLTIRSVRAGSVILEIDCSVNGARRIKSLFETQQLAGLFDFFKLESVSIDPIQQSRGMKCSEFRRELTEYLDGMIGPSAQAEMEEHLQWCHDCYVLLSATKKTIEVSRDNRLYELPGVLGVRLEIEQRLRMAKGNQGGSKRNK